MNNSSDSIERAYSTMEIKAAASRGGKRVFQGIASTPTTDHDGDIMEPKGAVFDLPMPMLWHHDAKAPIGWITSAQATDKGIEVTGEVAQLDTPGTLKDRLDEAWQSLQLKLVRGLSIGFKGIESMNIKGTAGLHYKKWKWLELSAVTIPSNMEANISAVKSLDLEHLPPPPPLRILPLGKRVEKAKSRPVVRLLTK
jgi:HK97 family phage prohead protease